MPQDQGEDLAQRLSRAIERIEGVTAAGVVLGDQGEIEEIHLVGPSCRRPKQIVRDTESLLCAQFGMRFDYRKISLVQVSPENNTPRRIRLRLIAARPHPKRVGQVQVILQNGDQRYEGSASIGLDTHREDGVSAVAGATLEAVQKAIGQIVHLTARDAQAVTAADRQVCLAMVSAVTPQGEEQLTGTCLVGNSVLEAASKATLDAINRRLVVWVAAYGAESAQRDGAGLRNISR